MSGIDSKNPNVGSGADPTGLQAPLTELPGAPQTGGAQATKGSAKAQAAEALLAADGTLGEPVNSTGEKKRTGHAALSTPPPMPPSAVRATPEHLQSFATLNSDLDEGMRRGAPANLPNFGAMQQQYERIDKSTPQGQQQAQQLQGRMAQTAVHTLSFPSSGGGLAAFLELAVNNQDKQKGLQGRLIDLNQTGQSVMSKQQIAQQEAQAKALEKAHKKEGLMNFLKPLLAIIALVATVLFPPSGPMLALALAGAVAGFVAGGIVGGKKDGTGFSFTAALEGAAMGAGVASLATALPRLLMSAGEKVVGLSAKIGTQAIEKGGMKAAANKMLEAGVQHSEDAALAATRGANKSFRDVVAAQLRTAGDATAKAGTKLSNYGDKVGKMAADSAIGKGAQRATEAITKTKNGAQDAVTDAAYAARNKFAETGAGKTLNVTSKEKPATIAKEHGVGDGTMATGQQVGLHVVEAGSQAVAGTVQFGVDREKANAAMAEAKGKVLKVIEEMMKSQGDRAQDAVQSLVQGRKASFDTVENVLRNGFQAGNNAIRGF